MDYIALSGERDRNRHIHTLWGGGVKQRTGMAQPWNVYLPSLNSGFNPKYHLPSPSKEITII